MKKIATVALALLASCVILAQSTTSDKLRAQKIGYITQKLALTPTEAQQFWPIYNEYEKKVADIKGRLKIIRTKNAAKASDTEVSQWADEEIALRQEESALLKEYHEKFKSVLPIKKVFGLYRAEEQFKRDLLKKLQGK